MDEEDVDLHGESMWPLKGYINIIEDEERKEEGDQDVCSTFYD